MFIRELCDHLTKEHVEHKFEGKGVVDYINEYMGDLPSGVRLKLLETILSCKKRPATESKDSLSAEEHVAENPPKSKVMSCVQLIVNAEEEKVIIAQIEEMSAKELNEVMHGRNTILTFAVQHVLPRVVKKLLEKGVDVNQPVIGDRDGSDVKMTAFDIAGQVSQLPIVTNADKIVEITAMLLSQGAEKAENLASEDDIQVDDQPSSGPASPGADCVESIESGQSK